MKTPPPGTYARLSPNAMKPRASFPGGVEDLADDGAPRLLRPQFVRDGFGKRVRPGIQALVREVAEEPKRLPAPNEPDDDGLDAARVHLRARRETEEDLLGLDERLVCLPPPVCALAQRP